LQKMALLLLLTILLISGSADATDSRTPHIMAKAPPEFTGETMPVYRLLTPEVNDSIVLTMSAEIFDVLGDVEESGGFYVVRDGNVTFMMDSSDGSIHYADHTKLWNLSLGDDLPTPEDCKAIADTFLSEHELLPIGLQYLNSGAGTARAYNIETGEVVQKPIHYRINYGFEVDGIPISETAASVSVIIGQNGLIHALDWSWREPVLVSECPVISLESVLERYNLSPSDVEESAVVIDGYTDPRWSEPFAGPTYHVQLESDYEDSVVGTLLSFPATNFSPWVAIESPSDGMTFQPGETVSFNCSVSGGDAPYTYLWSSSVDGDLSEQSSFSVADLSPWDPETRSLGHVITLTVIDDHGVVGTDSIVIQIVRGDALSDYTLEIVLGAGVLVVLGLLLFRRRRGGALALLLLMLFLGFSLPVGLSAGQTGSQASYYPASEHLIADEGDDAINEVGAEWLGVTASPKLPYSEDNIAGFYNIMGLSGYAQSFNFGEYSAYERDHKDQAQGGDDYIFVDAVDLAYYQGHGCPVGVFFSSLHDDMHLRNVECSFGDGDLEWIVFDSCEVLAWVDSQGANVFERWGPALQGVHMICGFSTTSYNRETRGSFFASYLTFPIFRYTIADAWFAACDLSEGSTVFAAVLYATASADPWNPQLDDPINDHAHGFGYVCSDPTPATAKWWVWLSSQC
jgi:hypothetical protein